jgi:hypothetical protein
MEPGHDLVLAAALSLARPAARATSGLRGTHAPAEAAHQADAYVGASA